MYFSNPLRVEFDILSIIASEKNIKGYMTTSMNNKIFMRRLAKQVFFGGKYYAFTLTINIFFRDSLFYERDMKDSNEALSRISSAKTQAVVVGDERLFNAAYATVISSNQTIDEIISKINGHLCEFNRIDCI